MTRIEWSPTDSNRMTKYKMHGRIHPFYYPSVHNTKRLGLTARTTTNDRSIYGGWCEDTGIFDTLTMWCVTGRGDRTIPNNSAFDGTVNTLVGIGASTEGGSGGDRTGDIKFIAGFYRRSTSLNECRKRARQIVTDNLIILQRTV